MGNSLGRRSGGLRLLMNRDCSYRIQLSESATIDLKERDIQQQDNGKTCETWKVTYTVEGLSCTLRLVKTTEGNEEELHIVIIDNFSCEKYNNVYNQREVYEIGRAEGNLLDVTARTYSIMDTTSGGIYCPYTLYPKKVTNALGGVTETTIHQYGEGTRKGLVVREWKKKRGDEKPYMGTVAHYYVYSREASSGSNKIDIGLSVVVMGLFNTLLLHCFTCLKKSLELRTGSQLHALIVLAFKGSSVVACLRLRMWFPPRPTQQNVLANDGAIRGNHNGNFFVNRLNLLGRRSL